MYSGEFTDAQLEGQRAVVRVLKHLGWEWDFNKWRNFQVGDDESCRLHEVGLRVFPDFEIHIRIRRHLGLWIAASAFVRDRTPSARPFKIRHFRFIYQGRRFKGLREGLMDPLESWDLEKCFEAQPASA